MPMMLHRKKICNNTIFYDLEKTAEKTSINNNNEGDKITKFSLRPFYGRMPFASQINCAFHDSSPRPDLLNNNNINILEL